MANVCPVRVKFWPFWRWIIDAATCSAFSPADKMLDLYFVFAPAAWIVFVPSQLYLCLRLSLSICRMSVRGGDLRAGADLAPRPGPTLQRHVLRPLRMCPGKSLFNSTFSPADWRVYLCLGLKVLRMDPTSLHNQKLVCELSKRIKSDKLSDPERQKLNWRWDRSRLSLINVTLRAKLLKLLSIYSRSRWRRRTR